MLLIFFNLWFILLCIFTFWVPCCDVRSNFRIKTMIRSSLHPVVCWRAHVVLLIVHMYIGTQNDRRFRKKHTCFSTTNVTTLLSKPTNPVVRWLHVLLTSSFICSPFIWFCIFCHWQIFWRFYFLWIIVIAYCITYNVSILMSLTFRILLILKRLLLLALPLPWSASLPKYSISSVFESLGIW